jgi:hypothetical protein
MRNGPVSCAMPTSDNRHPLNKREKCRMSQGFTKSQVAVAVAAAIGASAMVITSTPASAGKGQGKYLSGDFHNHTTCSDGSISMQKLVKKSTDKVDTPWGLDWFVQAGHGGNGNRNCTLVEDPTLDTPAYPYVSGKGPSTTWADSIGAAKVKGNSSTATSAGEPLSRRPTPACGAGSQFRSSSTR